MLLNITNHPSSRWSDTQKSEAAKFREIVDIPFPRIRPETSEAEIDELVKQYLLQVERYVEPVVLLQGEFIFTYRLIVALKKKGVRVVACQSDIERNEFQDENQNTVKNTVYKFGCFREY